MSPRPAPVRVRDRVSGSRLTVDSAAIEANARVFRSRAAGELMAVVKADGFGLGAGAVAAAARRGGATWFGVTSIEEGVALRELGFTVPVLSWLNPVDSEWTVALDNDIDLAVPSREHLTAVVAAARARRTTARLHLHADCGMARDGAPVDRWWSLVTAARRAQARGEVEVVGLMGHLARADTGPDDAGREAFRRFVAVARRAGVRPAVRHLAATSATLTDPASHFDLCRVGAGLVGIDPSGSTRLHPTVTWTAPVVAVRDVPAGTGVGYGHTTVTGRRTRLATLPVGYADGVPRVAGATASVQLRGRRCPVVGRVSMDQVVVDVGDLPVEPGDDAVLFGPGRHGEPTLQDWASWAGTIEHEIVTGIGARVRRVATGRVVRLGATA
ncbi:alanine racemase [Jatrophihabitans sp. YIM 134969]